MFEGNALITRAHIREALKSVGGNVEAAVEQLLAYTSAEQLALTMKMMTINSIPTSSSAPTSSSPTPAISPSSSLTLSSMSAAEIEAMDLELARRLEMEEEEEEALNGSKDLTPSTATRGGGGFGGERDLAAMAMAPTSSSLSSAQEGICASCSKPHHHCDSASNQ